MSNKYSDFTYKHRKSYGKSLQRETYTSQQMTDSTPTQMSFVRTGLNHHLASGFFSAKTLEESASSFKSPSMKHEYYPSLKSLKLRWKLNDMGLRETEDSMRHYPKKQGVSIQDFKTIKMLGKGRHGTVFLAM
jgi:RecA-family ATPase